MPTAGCSKQGSLLDAFQSVASRCSENIAVLHVSARSTSSTDGSRQSSAGSKAEASAIDDGLECSLAISEGVNCRSSDVGHTYGELLLAVDLLAVLLEHVVGRSCDAAAVLEGTGWEGDAQLEFPGIALVADRATSESGDCERKIGLMMVNSVEYLVCLLSVVKAGAAFVPLDLSWPLRRLEAVALSCKPCLVICCHHLLWSPRSDGMDVTKIASTFACPVLSVQEGFVKGLQAKTCPLRLGSSRKASYLYVLYTSGSTGTPRGVCGTETGLMNRLRWMEDNYPHLDGDVGCFKTAIGFVDHLTEALGPLLTASLLVVPPRNQISRNPLILFDTLKDYHITRLIAVPSLLHALLPRLQNEATALSLRILVLSGEQLQTWLWQALDQLLVTTTILNLYGSTEVSGDCTYFEVSLLHATQLKTSTVPIGRPISGLQAFVVSENDSVVTSGEGELWVAGCGVAVGYLNDPQETNRKFLDAWPRQSQGSAEQCALFKTGDLVTLLADGSFLLLGRKDRLVKVHGQRIQLEEVEALLQTHAAVQQAAVLTRTWHNGGLHLVAFVVLDYEERPDDLRNWLAERLPSFMVPQQIEVLRAMPVTSSGKVDYATLSTKQTNVYGAALDTHHYCDTVNKIVQVFAHVLNLERVSPSADFFALGGTSVSAAHVAHILSIDMLLLYSYPTATELCSAIHAMHESTTWTKTAALESSRLTGSLERSLICRVSTQIELLRGVDAVGPPGARTEQEAPMSGDTSFVGTVKGRGELLWPFHLDFPGPLALTRCNSICVRELSQGSRVLPILEVHGLDSRQLQPCWRVSLHSCVDGSPLLVHTAGEWRLFIGSHAKRFVCIDAASGELLWETEVGGRIESSAAVSFDFNQVIVGCYDGLIYFFDYWDGRIVWTFQTGGEVKCQPTLDPCTGLIWCGSHDHNIYALDSVQQCCVWQHTCGGSVFGAPACDLVMCRLYVASTSGIISAILTEPSPSLLWTNTCGAAVFGSPVVDTASHFLICVLVSGFVTAFTPEGEIAWKVTVKGPVFGGACLSACLPDQLLVCCRTGFLYAIRPGTGHVLWEHSVDDPVTASCCVDDSLQLLSKGANKTSRLICVCTTGGIVSLLQIITEGSQEAMPTPESRRPDKLDVSTGLSSESNQTGSASSNVMKAHEVARLRLPGEVFSSPVMMGGRLFVGCRDDHVYALELR